MITMNFFSFSRSFFYFEKPQLNSPWQDLFHFLLLASLRARSQQGEFIMDLKHSCRSPCEESTVHDENFDIILAILTSVLNLKN